MSKIILITGGCRSGKSRYALKIAKNIAENNKIFIATCVAYDDEMKQRILRHKKERDNSWKTIEEPYSISKAIKNNKSKSVIVVDCLTLWVNNLLFKHMDEDNIINKVKELIKVLNESSCPVILVTNEVGSGIVPENDLSRRFRDIAGFANQKIANCADKVYLMVAGIPLTVKDEGCTGCYGMI